MKKFSYVVASLLLGTAFTASSALARTHSNLIASGDAATAQQVQNEEEGKAYKELYEPCFDKAKKDDDKCYPLAKAFAEKYPSSQFFKYVNAKVTAYEGKKLYDAYQAALNDLGAGGDAAKLDKFLAAGEALNAKFPNPTYVTQMAMALGNGIAAGYYKDMAKAQSYAEKAMGMLEPMTTAPKDVKQADWDKYRTDSISNLTLYQGLYELRQPTPNVNKAVEIFNKITAHKDWPLAKSPNPYLLRAEANNITYDKLSEEYRALPDDDKRGDKGKAILAKIDPVVDSLIDDYARAYAIASKSPEMKAIADDVKPRLESFWKFRNNNKLDGMTEYIKRYESDPTAPPPKAASAAPTPSSPSAKPKG